MPATLQGRLAELQVTNPVEAGRLTLFGLRWDSAVPLDYLTLDEALQTGGFKVTEVSEGGSVPTLLVSNELDRRVLLLAGEQLIGAKQNRILNVTILAEKHAKLHVPVSCVEAGRWGYRSQNFSSKGYASHGLLRKMIARDVAESYRAGGGPTSKQGEVWREVDRKLCAFQSVSQSQALDQVYDDHAKRLEETLKSARLPEDCHGVVFVLGGKVAGVDIFDQPATLQKLLPKLTRAYALDALEIEGDGRLDRDAVMEWLKQAPLAHFERYASPGLGDDIRLESPAVVGAGLLVETAPVHVELFPNDDGPGQFLSPLPASRPAPRGTSPAGGPATSGPRPVTVQPGQGAESYGWYDAAGLFAFATSGSALQAVCAAVEALSPVFRRRNVALERSGLLIRIAPAEHDRWDATNTALAHAEEIELVRRAAERAPNAGQRIVFTGCGLADHWFAHWHPQARTAVVSLFDWSVVSTLPPAAFVACELVLHGWRLVSPAYDPARLLHPDTRGCLFDFCGEKQQVNSKLRAPGLCRACRLALESSECDPTSLLKTLQVVRSFTASGPAWLRPFLKYVRGRRL